HMFVDEDLSAFSEEELERELAEKAARVDAGLCRLVGLAAECERRRSWGAEGLTFARWLAWRCSLLPRQAREHERLGTRLAELPLIREAFARGELSYAKTSVLVRVAEPATEARLLELAEALTASQLARCVAAYRRVSAAEAADRQGSEVPDCFWGEGGRLVLWGRLAAEGGALFLRALESARDVLRERRRAEQAEAESARTEAVWTSPREEPVSSVEAFAAMGWRSPAATTTGPAGSAARSSCTSTPGRSPPTRRAAASSPRGGHSRPRRRVGWPATPPSSR